MSFLSPDTSRASTCCCQDWDQTFKALISITRLDDRISGEVANFIGIKLMGRFGVWESQHGCHLVTMATVPSQANESVGACLVCRSDPQRPLL